MKPSDLFGVVVRTLGLLLAVYGVWFLVYGVAQSLRVIAEVPEAETEAYFLSGLSAVAIGGVLMRCAHWFVQFSYPNSGVDEFEADRR